MVDSIVSAHEDELRQLRQSNRRKTLRLALILFGLIFVLGFGAAIWLTPMPVNDSLVRAIDDYTASGLDDYDGLAAATSEYHTWFVHHGITLESDLFSNTATKLLRSNLNFVDRFGDPGQMSFMGRAYMALHAGIIRIVFMILASWRLTLLAMLATVTWIYLKQKAYRGDDFLGQTGNSRQFFSGARVSFNEISRDGCPDQHVVGLACPDAEPVALVRTQPLGKFLMSQDAATETNLKLAGIILKAKAYPAYAPFSEDQGTVGVTATLPEQALRILERAFLLWRHYREISAQLETDARNEVELLAKLETAPISSAASADQSDATRYVNQLGEAFHRVNTPHGRFAIGNVTAAELASIILSFEAGKVLAFDREGERWVCRSRFPHLSGRAVLHAQASFGREYDYASRTLIRRALVYAARRSDFAPIRFPVDLAPESRAIRQWVELLAAQPTQLEAVADEIELLAIVTEAHQRWVQIISETGTGQGTLDVSTWVATPQQVFFVPFRQLVTVLENTVNPATTARIAVLSRLVSERQHKALLAERAKGDGAEREILASHERVLAPMSAALKKKLVDVHGLAMDRIELWSTLRLILASFAWLGRRVGDNPVSETGVGFGVFEVSPGTSGANALNLISRSAMVPLRGARLEELWGHSWRNRFDQVIAAKIADSKAELERLLAGIDQPQEESDALPTDPSPTIATANSTLLPGEEA